SAIYDMVKKFINEYSTLINEMDKLYNVKADSKYKPLTDEEKAAMSDYEIEKWEDKIKEQALSKDDNLSVLSSALKEVMASGIEVGGKTMHLFDFGIENAGYFTAADNEKNAFHIYGDKDDDMFANETNKLEYMISTDPETVEEFFYKLNRDLYEKMDKLSAKVQDTRTYGSFFDDLKLKSDYNDYKTRIDDLEAKLAAYEDKWYDKFGAMETAMAKMQSNQNAISSLLGNG
nr:flagellar filament capping protein FliD [Lachnospiraceae bacterium]